MRRVSVRGIGGFLVATTLLGHALGLPPMARAGAPLPEATAVWAWMVIRDPTADITRSPGRNSGNSSGGQNQVDHVSTGYYVLAFEGVGGDPGNVLVSTLGPQPKICSVADWGSAPGGVLIDVRCFTRSGAPADASFVVNWLAASGVGGKLAYGLNFSPTSNCGSPSDQYVSNGGSISTCPGDNGVARWVIPGLGSSRGTVQVTPSAHRAIDADLTAGICALIDFQANGADETLRVKCFETDGSSQIYRGHDAWFMQGLGMKGVDRTNVAYVLANRPREAGYTPGASHSYSSDGGTNTVRRLGTGRYEVKLPKMPLGGSAQVTALIGSATSSSRHCVVSSIEVSALPQRVGVRCFDADGDLRDTAFTLAYAR